MKDARNNAMAGKGKEHAMDTTVTLHHACGCRIEHAATYDGRVRNARQEAVAALERMYPPAEPCLKCAIAARTAKLAEFLPVGANWSWTVPVRHARAVARVAKITGGHISCSPKSDSLYVTWPTGAWRISNHPWPGRRESLISQHAAGPGTFVARLTPNWLAREKGKANDSRN